MICQLQGDLIAVHDGRAQVACGDLCYEVLVPACDAADLEAVIGSRVRFHTMHYLESHGQGSSFMPRLVGFRSVSDRAFFELFTTVKGLGVRKALRALRMPFAAVAEAIAAGDVQVLTTLPEIGRRTAQTIVAELHGKVDRFIEVKPDGGVGPVPEGVAALVGDAVTVLVRLGEPRERARQIVERAARGDGTIETTDALVAAALRQRDA